MVDAKIHNTRTVLRRDKNHNICILAKENGAKKKKTINSVHNFYYTVRHSKNELRVLTTYQLSHRLVIKTVTRFRIT